MPRRRLFALPHVLDNIITSMHTSPSLASSAVPNTGDADHGNLCANFALCCAWGLLLQDCLAAHWPLHKKACKLLKQQQQQ
jgi:hypothetical protein